MARPPPAAPRAAALLLEAVWVRHSLPGTQATTYRYRIYVSPSAEVSIAQERAIGTFGSCALPNPDTRSLAIAEQDPASPGLESRRGRAPGRCPQVAVGKW